MPANLKSLQLEKITRPFISNKFISDTNLNAQSLKLPYPRPHRSLTEIQVHMATQKHVEQAVDSSHEAFKVWSQKSMSHRRTVLLQIADALKANAGALASLESLNVGKPITEAEYDVQDAAECFRYFAGFADKVYGQTYQFNRWYTGRTLRRPVGVCAAITSFNYPLVLSTWKIAPALACGNTIIIKPHEETPLSVLYLAHLVKEYTDMLPGVLNVLPGDGKLIGNSISSHPAISKCSFTGSPQVGRLIMQASAQSNMKKVTLELGGKSPLIVFDDAYDLDKCADDIIGAIFSNAGQNCCAGSRLFIHANIYDQLLDRLKSRAEKLKLGDPLLRDTDIGPIVNQAQFEKIMRFISRAKDRNVPLLTGGSYLNDSLFVKPTIFYNVEDEDELAQQEIFGPVLSIMKPFTDDDQVLKRANSSNYGLASGIWTQNLDRAQRFEQELQTGITWINCYNLVHPGLPFGGVKESGFGHDLGWESVYQEYTRPKMSLTRRLKL